MSLVSDNFRKDSLAVTLWTEKSFLIFSGIIPLVMIFPASCPRMLCLFIRILLSYGFFCDLLYKFWNTKYLTDKSWGKTLHIRFISCLLSFPVTCWTSEIRKNHHVLKDWICKSLNPCCWDLYLLVLWKNPCLTFGTWTGKESTIKSQVIQRLYPGSYRSDLWEIRKETASLKSGSRNSNKRLSATM